MKKGQMQLGESIAIIIILLVLTIFALIFYSKVKEVDIEQSQVLHEELDIVRMSQLVYYLPEIQCSFAEVTDYGCIDVLKFNFLSQLIDESFNGNDQSTYFYYRELFGVARISLETYDNSGAKSTSELFNSERSLDTKNVVYMPVVVHNPIVEFNNFGVLIVEKYS